MPKKILILTQLLLICFFSLFIAISALATLAITTTIDNLNTALRGETNASHRYEVFAKKADSEGYKQVAKLFRAVSMAESVHRNNHKAVLLGLGAKLDVVDYDPIEVHTTKENLELPLVGEQYEQEVMYPNFIKQAKAEKLPNAVKSFTYAKRAEKQHEALFKDALENLGKNAPANYCVSRISGATFAKEVGQKCPQGKCGVVNEYILIK